ncbi:hypothetical protein F4819DRAFT_463122 [Hypoxylon fuscum]|nr:hypothetical protein F4819DRAFT_463122 [Hypoxylon fuscum]
MDPRKHPWEDGDIAFLKGVDEFSDAQYRTLVEPGYLRERATKHPVIILEHSPDSKHFLVTTVSAYSSDASNRYRPPWDQPCHSDKTRDDFRAFAGSKRPNDLRPDLQLKEGQSFPKPKTSWVYARNYFVVPASVLKKFGKGPARLQMTQESLKDLKDHMKKVPRFGGRWKHPVVLKMLKASAAMLPSTNISGAPMPRAPPTTPSPTSSREAPGFNPRTVRPSHAATWSAVASGPWPCPA